MGDSAKKCDEKLTLDWAITRHHLSHTTTANTF